MVQLPGSTWENTRWLMKLHITVNWGRWEEITDFNWVDRSLYPYETGEGKQSLVWHDKSSTASRCVMCELRRCTEG